MWEQRNELTAYLRFTIEKYLKHLVVKIIIPSFLKERSQFNEHEIVKNQQITNKPIHVKRMFHRLKWYHILVKFPRRNIEKQ